MSAKKKMQHLTVFLLKKHIKKFEAALKPDSDAGQSTALTGQSFEGSLYMPDPVASPPTWLPFIQSGFPGQNVKGNQMASALLFLKARSRLFAVAFA